jgi:hypothetical protein
MEGSGARSGAGSGSGAILVNNGSGSPTLQLRKLTWSYGPRRQYGVNVRPHPAGHLERLELGGGGLQQLQHQRSRPRLLLLLFQILIPLPLGRSFTRQLYSRLLSAPALTQTVFKVCCGNNAGDFHLALAEGQLGAFFQGGQLRRLAAGAPAQHLPILVYQKEGLQARLPTVR